MQSTNRDAALALVSHGLHIFPCRPDKTPMVIAWEQAAFNSPFAVGIKWDAAPDALPAIPVGAHDLVVIDCDRKNGVDGVTNFEALCVEHRIDLSNAFVVETPSDGLHFYWRADTAYGNSRGFLPDGIDVRGVGGYVIAPGAVLPDGRSYKHLAGSWDAIPALPKALAALLKRKSAPVASELPTEAAERLAATERECAYAEDVLADECAVLSAVRQGEGRNAALNRAAHSAGTMVGTGWIERATAEQALWAAAEQNGYRAKDGDAAAWKTLQSGLESGVAKPREPLPAIDIPQWLRDSVARWIEAYKAKQSNQVTSKRSVTLIPFSDIEERPVEWLWNQYLPLGKLTLLAGSGGTGKSTIAFSFAGTISTGGTWPDGSRCNTAGNVLIWSSEDDPADTIKPRLLAVSANVQRCRAIKGATDKQGIGRSFDPARDMSELREAVVSIGGISLLVIDPIVSAVTGDMNKANDVRRSLQTFVDFAAEMNCAVLGITHFAKATAGKDSAERILGSSAFKDFSRTALVVAKNDETGERAFARAKSNLSADADGFSYGIEALQLHRNIIATRIVWGEALKGSARSILAKIEGDSREDGDKMKAAKQFLIEMLGGGAMPAKDLLNQAREGYGITEDTLRRAYKEIGVKPNRVGFGSNGAWMWALPFANSSR